MRRVHWLLLTLLLILSPFSAAEEGIKHSISDFGGVGLIQTPTARMFDAGEVGVFLTKTDQYRHQGVQFQPTDWFQALFRYTDIGNMNYGQRISGLSYKDKSVDFRFGLAQESYYVPQVALGINDVGGTGLFSSEYFVASKRVGDFDIHLGLGWGYLGNRGDIKNPFSLIFGDGYDDRHYFDKREKYQGNGGKVDYTNMFKGAPSFFGGIEYQTPWNPLTLKVEYDGNNYKNEPRKDLQRTPSKQDYPLNVAAVFHINDSLDLNASYERGNVAALGMTLHTNFGDKNKPTTKTRDPQPEPVAKLSQTNSTISFRPNELRERLSANSGYFVREISFRDKEIIMRGQPTKYTDNAKGIGRAARVLSNSVNSNDIEWITIIDEAQTMPIKETTIKRDTFIKAANNDTDLEHLRRDTFVIPVSSEKPSFTNIYEFKNTFAYGIGLGMENIIGGPDASILYQINLEATADYFFSPGLWWSGKISHELFGNYDQFKIKGRSKLPKVRTDIREYAIAAGYNIPYFQMTYAKELYDDVYSLWYTGMFETMYGGAGGEILYRPFGERIALGIDVNWVKQRDFEQDFNFRDYSIVTGHVTTYWDTQYNDILITTSAGRYLAGDVGVTFDISRSFRNGVKFGGWATKTNVSSKQFGEGSFDKGIYISAPFDLILSTSSRKNMDLRWQPIMRDGGAKLWRRFQLYPITSGSGDLDNFNDNFDHILD